MAFDPSTAKPVLNFDPSTAQPLSSESGATTYTEPAASPKSAREMAIEKFRAGTGMNRTPGNSLLQFIIGMGQGGQNIGDYFARKAGYQPKPINIEKTFGGTPETRSEFVQGLGQSAPLIPLTGTGAGLLAESGVAAGYGATQAPGNESMGAAVTGGTTAGVGILNNLLASQSPVVRALSRAGIGSLVGYGVGGPGGAATGAGVGVVAPTLTRRLGLTRANPAAELVDRVSPTDQLALDRAQAAQRIGGETGSISPGEATGRPDIISDERMFGRLAPEEKVAIGNERVASQKSAIRNLKSDISSEGRDAAYDIRKAAQDHLDELKQIRAKEAEPYYQAAKSEEIPQHELDKLMETPRIKNTYSEILNDPDYLDQLKGKQPTGRTMIAMIENRIDNLISQAEKKPYNKPRLDELRYARDNLTTDYGDPMVQGVLREIYNNDPVFHAAAMGINPRSIEVLDLVKKRIDTAAENMGSPLNMTGKDKYKAGLIGSAAEKITSTADKYSENYAIARAKFADMSPYVGDAEQSILKKLAGLKDTQLKSASKMIFDPSQTNLRVLGKVKQQIMRKNPKAWDAIVRNEIERLNKKGEINGTTFYNNTLKNDNQFKQFELAIDHNPKALQTLRDMKLAWEHLVNVESARTAAGMSDRAMNKMRASFEDMINMVAESIGSKQQAEAIKYLYSPRWIADVRNINKTANRPYRMRHTAAMMARILPPSFLSTKSDNTANE